MDDWGDPWAEDRTEGSPEKEIVGASEGVKRASVLGEFGDEAHWDNDDAYEKLDGWSSQVTTDLGNEPAAPDDLDKSLSQVEIVKKAQSKDVKPGSMDGSFGTFGGRSEDIIYQPALPSAEDNKSGSIHLRTHSDAPLQGRTFIKIEAVDSASGLDSHSTSDGQAVFTEMPPSTSYPQSQPSKAQLLEDDTSTRSSTSPSDVSQPVVSIGESTRTSFEDDHTFSSTPKASLADNLSRDSAPDEQEQDDDFGDFEEQVPDEDMKEEDKYLSFATPGPTVSKGLPISDGTTKTGTGLEDPQSRPRGFAGRQGPIFEANLSPINQLFLSPRASEKLPDAAEDIISSTSARKAWYRITRKQTLREFSKGEDDDHYVRIAWKGSAIQAQVNRTVSRWASEDRIHGRVVLGGRPGAIFGWDESSQSGHLPSTKSNSISDKPLAVTTTRNETAAKHARSTSRVLGTPTTKRTSLVDASPVAQFSWSSSPVPANASSVPLSEHKSLDIPRKSVSARPNTSPATASVPRSTGRHGKWASVNLSAAQGVSIKHHRASQSINFPAAVKDPIALEVNDLHHHSKDTLTRMNILDGSSDQVPLKSTLTMDTDAGDDEWGEMVHSPMSPGLAPIRGYEQPKSSPLSDFNVPNAIPAPAKVPVRSYGQTAPPMSPLVPLSDMGSAPVSSTTPETPPTLWDSKAKDGPIPDTTVIRSDPQPLHEHQIQQLPQSDPILASTASPAPDPWSSADFSIFETLTVPDAAGLPQTNPSSFSHKQSPVQRTPSLERNPHPSPPSTVRASKTSTEMESDEIAKTILQGLPDLGYMLR